LAKGIYLIFLLLRHPNFHLAVVVGKVWRNREGGEGTTELHHCVLSCKYPNEADCKLVYACAFFMIQDPYFPPKKHDLGWCLKRSRSVACIRELKAIEDGTRAEKKLAAGILERKET
jgi:hypothetical protein